MPVQIVITGQSADEACTELKRMAAPLLQAQVIAERLAGKASGGPAAGTEGNQPAAAAGEADRGSSDVSPATEGEVMPEDDPHYGKGANNPAARELNAEAAAEKRRGRKPKGTVTEKGAPPTASEAIIPKFKVIFDDHEEHFDALGEAFERMQDFVEEAPDIATIDVFWQHNAEWILALGEKQLPLKKVLATTIAEAKAALNKPAAPANDADTKIAYTLEHLRAAMRALVADRSNEVLNDDQKREQFLRMRMTDYKAQKIMDLSEANRDDFIKAIVQVLSTDATAGLKQKWAEIK